MIQQQVLAKPPFPIGIQLMQMGFDISRLEFYRWLVNHDKNPDWVGVQPVRHKTPPLISR